MTRLLARGDRAGIIVAIACAAHCLAAPALATSLQLAAVFVSEQTELLLLASSLLISGATVVTSCLHRRTRRAVWVAYALGASVILYARVGGAWAGSIERPLVVCGAGAIVAAHLTNLLACRCREELPLCVATE